MPLPTLRFNKRPYLILEVVISMTLAALLAIPILQIHTQQVQRTLRSLTRLQLTHHAMNYSVAIQELLYNHDISWENLQYHQAFSTLKHPSPLASGTTTIYLSHSPRRPATQTYQYHATLREQEKGKIRGRSIYRLIEGCVIYTPTSQTSHTPPFEVPFTLFAERIRIDKVDQEPRI